MTNETLPTKEKGDLVREILFRGKPIDQEWWLENFERFSSMEEWAIGNLIASDEGYWIVGGIADVDDEYIAHEWWVKVRPETVGQYIGLMDKTLTKIFEHDIVKNDRGLVGYVSFLQQSMGYHIVYKNTDERLGHRHRGGHYEVDLYLEVIGNIHDNPKLLEGLRYDMQK